IMALGASGEKVEWAGHCAWLERAIASPDTLLFVAMVDGAPAGQIRFERRPGDLAKISIYLLRQFRGRGIGSALLGRACQRAFGALKVGCIEADVLSGNSLSLSFFAKTGFTPRIGAPAGGSLVTLSMARPAPVPHNRLSFGEEEARSVAAT